MFGVAKADPTLPEPPETCLESVVRSGGKLFFLHPQGDRNTVYFQVCNAACADEGELAQWSIMAYGPIRTFRGRPGKSKSVFVSSQQLRYMSAVCSSLPLAVLKEGLRKFLTCRDRRSSRHRIRHLVRQRCVPSEVRSRQEQKADCITTCIPGHMAVKGEGMLASSKPFLKSKADARISVLLGISGVC